MVHCGEKWVNLIEKHPEICEMSEDYRRKVEKWTRTCEGVIARGFDRNVVFKKFPEGAHRELPAEDDPLWERAINYVCNCLKRGEKVTGSDLKKTVAGWRETDNCTSCSGEKRNTIVLSSSPKIDVRPKNTDVKKPPAAPAEPQQPVEQPAHTPAAVPVQDPTENVEEIPCKVGKPCPGGRDLLLKSERDPRTKAVIGLGDKCAGTGGLIRDVKVCPVIQREKAAQANAAIFTTGGKIKALDERAPGILPRAAQNQPMELTIRFTGKQWAILKQVGREQQLSIEEAVLFLVDEAGERMEGA